MRDLSLLLCIILTVVMTSSLCADTDEADFYEFDTYEPRPSTGFSWLFARYEFDRIEEYFDEHYIDRYRHWEKILISKQREFAGKFGLTDIFLRPDFRNYENTKIALSKSVWSNRLLFRYLAPVGDVGDFELFVALKPYQFMTFVMRGQLNEERLDEERRVAFRVALVVNQSLGRGKISREQRYLRQFLGQAKRLAD